MLPSIICRFCLKNCADYKCLYDENGKRNAELYNIASRYIHPKHLTAVKGNKLTAICLTCWSHVADFHDFHNKYPLMQSNNNEILSKSISPSKAISGDLPNEIERPLTSPSLNENEQNTISITNSTRNATTPQHSGDLNVIIKDEVSDDDTLNDAHSIKSELATTTDDEQDEDYCESVGTFMGGDFNNTLNDKDDNTLSIKEEKSNEDDSDDEDSDESEDSVDIKEEYSETEVDEECEDDAIGILVANAEIQLETSQTEVNKATEVSPESQAIIEATGQTATETSQTKISPESQVTEVSPESQATIEATGLTATETSQTKVSPESQATKCSLESQATIEAIGLTATEPSQTKVSPESQATKGSLESQASIEAIGLTATEPSQTKVSPEIQVTKESPKSQAAIEATGLTATEPSQTKSSPESHATKESPKSQATIEVNGLTSTEPVLLQTTDAKEASKQVESSTITTDNECTGEISPAQETTDQSTANETSMSTTKNDNEITSKNPAIEKTSSKIPCSDSTSIQKLNPELADKTIDRSENSKLNKDKLKLSSENTLNTSISKKVSNKQRSLKAKSPKTENTKYKYNSIKAYFTKPQTNLNEQQVPAATVDLTAGEKTLDTNNNTNSKNMYKESQVQSETNIEKEHKSNSKSNKKFTTKETTLKTSSAESQLKHKARTVSKTKVVKEHRTNDKTDSLDLTADDESLNISKSNMKSTKKPQIESHLKHNPKSVSKIKVFKKHKTNDKTNTLDLTADDESLDSQSEIESEMENFINNEKEQKSKTIAKKSTEDKQIKYSKKSEFEKQTPDNPKEVSVKSQSKIVEQDTNINDNITKQSVAKSQLLEETEFTSKEAPLKDISADLQTPCNNEKENRSKEVDKKPKLKFTSIKDYLQKVAGNSKQNQRLQEKSTQLKQDLGKSPMKNLRIVLNRITVENYNDKETETKPNANDKNLTRKQKNLNKSLLKTDSETSGVVKISKQDLAKCPIKNLRIVLNRISVKNWNYKENKTEYDADDNKNLTRNQKNLNKSLLKTDSETNEVEKATKNSSNKKSRKRSRGSSNENLQNSESETDDDDKSNSIPIRNMHKRNKNTSKLSFEDTQSETEDLDFVESDSSYDFSELETDNEYETDSDEENLKERVCKNNKRKRDSMEAKELMPNTSKKRRISMATSKAIIDNINKSLNNSNTSSDATATNHLKATSTSTQTKDTTMTSLNEKPQQHTPVYDQIIVKWKAQLECGICQKTHANFGLLEKHFSNKHGNKETYISCCGLKLKTRQQISYHAQGHMDTNTIKYATKVKNYKYKCEVCHISCKHSQDLLEHASVHTNTHIYKCLDCPQTFRYRGLLYKHLKTLHRIKFSTREDYIEKLKKMSFTTVVSDDKLKFKEASGKQTTTKLYDDKKKFRKTLDCPLCAKEQHLFSTWSELAEHFKEFHPKENCYTECCNRTFFHREIITDHARVHLDPDCINCQFCGKTFTRSSNLQRHVREVHKLMAVKDTVAPPRNRAVMDAEIAAWKPNLKCGICQETSPNFAKLAQHFFRQHPNKAAHIVCCNRKFLRREQIADHVVYHKDKNAYKCEICDKCCFFRHDLYKHMWRKHSIKSDGKAVTKRIHKCKVCKETFANPQTLRDHMTVHTGEYLYQCGLCAQPFGNRPSVYDHLQKEHAKAYEQRAKNPDKKLLLPYKKVTQKEKLESNKDRKV